jgi:hypothetical protein
MFVAKVNDRISRPSEKVRRGQCPSCKATVVAKTGVIVAWHWAHRNQTDCDAWALGNATEWRYNWQSEFPLEWCEVPVIEGHRADVLTPANVVVQFQHSSITGAAVIEREQAYGSRLVWVFNAIEPYDDGRLDVVPLQDNKVRFCWVRPRRIEGAYSRVVLDLGPKVLVVSDLSYSPHDDYAPNELNGKGWVYARGDFVQAIKESSGTMVLDSPYRQRGRRGSLGPPCAICKRSVVAGQSDKLGRPCHYSCQ